MGTRERPRPGKRPLMASVGVHLAVLGLAWFTQGAARELPEFVTYQIVLVSPPSTRQAPEPEPEPPPKLEVETPKPVVEEAPKPVVEERRRVEERPRPTPSLPTPPPPERPAGNPEPSRTESGLDLNVRMEGLKRDFPEYYQNIIVQIARCFRFSGVGRWETTVVFYINRDGTVNGDEIRFVERSGNVDFDFAAMGAVECAGRGRFGPLPPELGLDRLPILFTFTPRSGGTDPT